MTNQEAIEILQTMEYELSNQVGSKYCQKKYEAVKMSIEALEQESILDKIKSEILCNIVEDDTSGNTPARLRADWDAANKAHMINIALIDRYKVESEGWYG